MWETSLAYLKYRNTYKYTADIKKHVNPIFAYTMFNIIKVIVQFQ